jgi:hypothetical protein
MTRRCFTVAEAPEGLALLTYIDLAAKVEKLQLIEAFGIILSAFAALVSLEAEGGSLSPEENLKEPYARALSLAREMPQRTEDLERNIAVGGLLVWAAFKVFCAWEMGLEAQKLLEALAQPLVERARELKKIAERLQVEPDSEIVADCAATLRENWQRQLLARG